MMGMLLEYKNGKLEVWGLEDDMTKRVGFKKCGRKSDGSLRSSYV